MIGGGFNFETKKDDGSRTQYVVLSNSKEFPPRDVVESRMVARVADVREFGDATVIFLENSQVNGVKLYQKEIVARRMRLVVRAVAGKKDSLHSGREPQVLSRAESDKAIDYITQGGSFRLFVESTGKGDFNKEKVDLGKVEFYPQVGSRAIIIPRNGQNVPTITGKVESYRILKAQSRLLSTLYE